MNNKNEENRNPLPFGALLHGSFRAHRDLWFVVIFLISFSFLAVMKLYAQPSNSARLTILAGGNVPFFFSSMQQYATGITYTNYTTFSMEVVDLAPPPVVASWSLDVEALSANFVGDNPANTLPLSTMRLQATAFPSGCGGCVSTGIQILPGPGLPVDLVTGGPLGAPPPSHQVSISYFCGTVVPLLGARPDHYVVDIEFTLKPL